MHKTDVDNIMQASTGILISTAKPTGYLNQHKKMLELEADRIKINRLESEMNIIKSMLQQIINKVNT